MMESEKSTSTTPSQSEHLKSVMLRESATRRVFGITKGSSPGWLTELAYRAHSGTEWRVLSDDKKLKNLQNQLYGGRSLEVLICEGLIRGGFIGFHFLPPKELDLHHKTDLISRIPYKKSGKSGKIYRTFAIGSQLTLMELPENIKGEDRDKENKIRRYNDKLEQVRAMNQFLHVGLSRQELKGKYGKLSVPDIMAFIAVNGELRKSLGNTSNYTYIIYQKWEKASFPVTGLIGEFKERLRMVLYDIISFISGTQNFIFSSDFLFQLGASKGVSFVKEAEEGRIEYIFDNKTGELECFLYSEDKKEVLAKAVYLFIQDDIKKLALKRRSTDRNNK